MEEGACNACFDTRSASVAYWHHIQNKDCLGCSALYIRHHCKSGSQSLRTLDKAGGSRPGKTETGDFRGLPKTPSSQATLTQQATRGHLMISSVGFYEAGEELAIETGAKNNQKELS